MPGAREVFGMVLCLPGCSLLFSPAAPFETTDAPDASLVLDARVAEGPCSASQGEILLSDDFESGLGNWASSDDTDRAILVAGQEGQGMSLCAKSNGINLDARLIVDLPSTLPRRFTLTGWTRSEPAITSGMVLISLAPSAPSVQHPAPPIDGDTNWVPFEREYTSIDDLVLEDLKLMIRSDPANLGDCLYVDSLCLTAVP